MYTLMTIGYQGLKPDELKAAVNSLGAVLADIRFSPMSRDPAWRKHALVELFGPAYCHIRQLGNPNYRGDGPMTLLDEQSGAQIVYEMLQIQPVILMCACWNLLECHRLLAVSVIITRYPCEVKHLNRMDVKALAFKAKSGVEQTQSRAGANKAKKLEESQLPLLMAR